MMNNDSDDGAVLLHLSEVLLNLHDVGLLLPPSEDLHLSVNNDSDDGAVLLHLSEVLLNLLLSQIIAPLSAGLGEGLLLGLRPILVESPFGLLSDVLGPDGLEGSHAPGGLDVADHADADEGWSLDDGDGLHNLLLVDLGAGSVHLPHNVCHAGLVAKEGGHVHWLGGVIFREGLAFSHVTLRSLLWQKTLGAMAGSLEFSVRHVD